MAKKKNGNDSDLALEAAILEAQERGEADYQGTIWFPDTVLLPKEKSRADGSTYNVVVSILPGYYPQVQIDHYKDIQERFPTLNDRDRLTEQGFLLDVEEPPRMMAVDITLNDRDKKDVNNLKLPTAVVRQTQ